MSKPSLFPLTSLYLVLLFLHTHLPISNEISILGLDSLKNSEMDVMAKRACTQNIGECFTEPEMDSGTSRRVLVMQKKYISYETLRRDMTPCQTPGSSYYNCHAGTANPYNRGCEVITGCARGIIKTWWCISIEKCNHFLFNVLFLLWVLTMIVHLRYLLRYAR